ncbi:MAG: hypothetical protein M3Q81_04870, partial [bacterium]|nr:hypothetical protein [bacterium]
MQQPACLPLADCGFLSIQEVGTVAQQLGTFTQEGISVSPGLVVPVSLLKEIVLTNGVQEKLHTVLEQPEDPQNFKRLRKMFSQLQLPPKVVEDFTYWYLHQGRAEGLVVLESPVIRAQLEAGKPTLPVLDSPIEAIDTMLELWANSVNTFYQLRENLDEALYSQSFIFMASGRGALTATAYSMAIKDGSKKTIQIDTIKTGSTSPVQSFAVDIRTQEVLNAPEKRQWLITEKQLQTIATQTQQLKRHFMSHIIAHWQLSSQGCEVLYLEELSSNSPILSDRTLPSTKKYSQAFIVGKKVSPGMAQGSSVVL